ncbi:hypothetical protein [Nocardia sp. NPDC059228]|uniref:hypothetical protein n=1 Tax=Nocardia sp. NPDC059228 TaxID=3346777 RepID=UPI00369BDF9D
MPAKYDEATRTKAIRLVIDHRDDYDSEWAAIGNADPARSHSSKAYTSPETPADTPGKAQPVLIALATRITRSSA